VSTWGSLLGTYLSVLLVIPTAGTRLAALIFGSLLLLIGLIGLWLVAGRRALPATIVLPLLLLVAALAWTRGGLKEYPGQVYEKESAYNYIQVVRQDDCNYLLLNEGQAYHSYYCDGGRVPRISVWTLMLAAPYFNDATAIADPLAPMGKVAVIGLAAGTIPKQITEVFGPVPIAGVELDPAIVAIGQEYFALNEPNIEVIVGDGRHELNRLPAGYDLITLDAYKVPYIPWHLTTREFFQEVHDHLSDDGALAVNVGRAPDDRRLVEAITATLLEVFPSVHTMDVPGSLNSILVATVRPTTASNLAQNMARLDATAHPLLRDTLAAAAANLAPTVASNVTFTDERAPVETIIDSIVLRYLLREGPAGLPGVGG
jgi:spermidine synthase